MNRFRFLNVCVLLTVFVTGTAAGEEPPLRWFRGNTHTHTWWSDGDSPPEMVTAWYKEHGYHFLVLSDHNALSNTQRWIVPSGARGQAAAAYEKQFGSAWVQKRPGKDGKTEYRLRQLEEFAPLFNEPGRFLMIQGEEISDRFEKRPVHLNGVNLREVVPPQGGATIVETMQKNIDAVLAQRERLGWPMFAHVNHPNFHYAITADDLATLKGEQFFEVYNGHPGVANHGDADRPSTDRIWDVILTKRLAELNLPVMYGVATDDAHTYTSFGVGKANPGRGWVMVRARYLTPVHIVEALEAGDFYATTGVLLDEIQVEGGRITLKVQEKPGVSYTTQFIGTRRGYDPKPTSRYSDPRGFLVHKYSDTIGQVLAEAPGPNPSYTFKGDEIYVRAKVVSTAPHPNPFAEGDVETAWTQPVVPR